MPAKTAKALQFLRHFRYLTSSARLVLEIFSLEAMEQDDRAPAELVDLLRRILREYDSALERI